MSSPNRDLLLRVASQLTPLLDELVFVGGHVAELLIIDEAAVRVRPTGDVDIICCVAGRTGYQQLGTRLKRLGFREDASAGAPV